MEGGDREKVTQLFPIEFGERKRTDKGNLTREKQAEKGEGKFSRESQAQINLI